MSEPHLFEKIVDRIILSSIIIVISWKIFQLVREIIAYQQLTPENPIRLAVYLLGL